VTNFSPTGAGRYLRQDWFTVFLVTMVMVACQWAFNWTETLELGLYDAVSSRSVSPPSKQVAIIAIDDSSIAKLGAWPWPRELHATLIAKLAQAKTKAIVPVLMFTEPESDRGLRFIRQIKSLLGDPAQAAPAAAREQLNRVLAEAEVALDGDGLLIQSVRNAGNVIIPWISPGSRTPAQNMEPLASSASALGHLHQRPDPDGVFRRETLLHSQSGQDGMRSLALLAAAAGMDSDVSDIKLNFSGTLQLGKRRLPVEKGSELLVPLSKKRNGQPMIAEDSFVDVLRGEKSVQDYAGKVVIIGIAATDVGANLTVPGGASLTQPQVIAQVVSDLMEGRFTAHPDWGKWLTLGGLLLIFAYLVAALPVLTGVEAVFVSLLILLALLGAETFLLYQADLWIELVFPAAVLVVGHLTLGAKHLALRPANLPKEPESEKTRRMMALALQGQGQLDMAFDRLRRVPFDEAVMADLYGLALEFERKNQHAKAQAVYRHMAVFNENFRDVKAKLNPVYSRPVVTPSGLTQLGRYRIERELGKGAMGVVYLGRDPTIGRVVAIKTMALSQEFEGEELAEVRERFFREAEAAGRLQHQNIVTIFDAGEDNELAYIAMEFLNGSDLGAFCSAGQLLPVPAVLSIAARVADALGYAHGQNIVHRDIKPANIMFDPSTDTLKVADFGIARITDSSKTKTGLVLGTPSFMSPEQLAGKKVDGRTDLYSLGVLLFQMLTGVLPFHGDSLAELMQKIAQQAAPDVRLIRPDLSLAVATLVEVSLRKNPSDRYQRGGDMAQEIRAVLSGLTGGLASQAKNESTMQVPTESAHAEKTILFATTIPGFLPEFEKTAKMTAATGEARPNDTLAAELDLMPTKK
jgi:CHASE2 domain-containing sensor protein/tRNA A-37 threonylcarbamoyl transferase component Bud32